MAIANPETELKPEEEIPFDTYALLEGRLQQLRTFVMTAAVNIARAEKPHSAERVVVQRKHITKALELLAAQHVEKIQALLKGDVVVGS